MNNQDYREPGLRKYILVLFFVIFLIVQNANGKGVMDSGIRIREKLERGKETVLNRIIFSDTLKSFGHLVDFVHLYLNETQQLVHMDFIENRKWVEELKRHGFISTALIDAGGLRYSIGETAAMSVSEDLSYYVDVAGKVHYVYFKKEDSFYVDMSLTFSGLERYVMKLERQPASMFLYDRIKNQYSIIYGSMKEIPRKVFQKDTDILEPVKLLTPRNIILMKRIEIGRSDLVLIAIYPYKLSKASVQLFGLIGVVGLTILLLYFVIYFIFQSIKKPGVVIMEEEEKAADIISEIDKELSDVVKEEKKPSPEKKPEEEDLKKLEDDGIHIHK